MIHIKSSSTTSTQPALDWGSFHQSNCTSDNEWGPSHQIPRTLIVFYCRYGVLHYLLEQIAASTIAAACQQYKKRHVMSLHGNVQLQVLLLASIVSGTHWMASYRLPRSLAQRDADGQTLRLHKDLHRKQHYPTYNHSFSSVTTRVRAFSYYLVLSAALYNLSLSSSSSQPVPVTGHCFLSVLSPAHD